MGYGLLAIALASTKGVWSDPGFERLSPGPLAGTSAAEGWEVQRQGRESILPRLSVVCLRDALFAHSGKQCLLLSIPRDTVGFEFVTVGRRVQLRPDSVYEASVWVRWTGGPKSAPASASPVSGHPSAIVSFWARHRDAKGEFAGRDEWLFDDRWKRLSFRFPCLDPTRPTLVYVSLLPNQKPIDTTVLVDDFELNAHTVPTAVPQVVSGSVVADGRFHRQKPGTVVAPWSFAATGGDSIRGGILEAQGERFFAMRMNKSTTNYESAQLWQMLDLQEGIRYEVSCRMRWDNYEPDTPPPIVNYGIWHEGSRTWYGPVDQTLERTDEWRTYRFTHIPPFGGRWKLYVQLNGWGNFGKAVAVSFDDFNCVAAH
jgi:hypothetical protein